MQSKPFDSFMDQAPVPIAIFDDRLRFVSVNQAMAAFDRVTSEAHLGKTVDEVLPGLSMFLQPLLAQVLATGELTKAPVTGGFPSYLGAPHHWLAVCFPSGDSRIAFMALEATEEQTEEALQRSNRQLESTLAELERTALINEMNHCLQAAMVTEELSRIVGRFAPRLFPRHAGALYVIDSSRNMIDASATWGNISAANSVFSPHDCWALREGRAHLVNDPVGELVCPHAALDRQHAQICVPLIAQAEMLGFVHLQSAALHPRGEAFTEGELRLVQIMAGEIALSFANVGMREVLREQAFRDPLTSLYNRRFLQEALQLELRRAKRSRLPVALIMLDVDRFKKFNDTYGHLAGDSFLQTVANSLQSSVRANDVVCRYGGDEFCIAMPEASLENALAWARKRKSASRYLSIDWQGKTLAGPTLSIGIAAYPACSTLDALFLDADAALYAAKAAGGDQVRPSIHVPASSSQTPQTKNP